MFEPEEYQIVKRIKDFIRSKNLPEYFYIMLRNRRILDTRSYFSTVSSGKIDPQDTYIYIGIGWDSSRSAFYYPFLRRFAVLLHAYLSKLGLQHEPYTVPAIGLKYVADVERYGDYLSIELLNLDTTVNNLNLRKIVFEVVGEKMISGEKELATAEFDKIYYMFESQQFLAGYDLDKAWNIIVNYYDKGNQSLAKEVARIAIDYDRIFHSYRVCYETKTWKEIDCSTIT